MFYFFLFKGEKIDDFFETLRLREEETLNGVVVAGSCQFSSVADQLFGQPCTKTWRGDVYLRRLALHIIAANEVIPFQEWLWVAAYM